MPILEFTNDLSTSMCSFYGFHFLMIILEVLTAKILQKLQQQNKHGAVNKSP